MNFKSLWGDNVNGDGLSVDRIYTSRLNPFGQFQQYQQQQYHQIPYNFQSASGNYGNLYGQDGGAGLFDANHGFGLKLGYGHSGGGHTYEYGPMKPKGGKLKGAALSALTLLAFLFFLNLLQTCLKEHMDTMNPTVMVMTARSNLKANKRLDKIKEDSYDDDSSQDYTAAVIDTVHRTQANPEKSVRLGKSGKSTIAPKLQNLFQQNHSNLQNTNNFQFVP